MRIKEIGEIQIGRIMSANYNHHTVPAKCGGE